MIFFLNIKGKIIRKLALKMPVTTRSHSKTNTFVPKLVTHKSTMKPKMNVPPSGLMVNYNLNDTKCHPEVNNKNINTYHLKPKNDINDIYSNAYTESIFVAEIKLMLAQCESAVGKSAKMQIAIQIMKKIETTLFRILENTKVSRWIQFAATVYYKTIEFEVQGCYKNFYDDVDPELVKTHIETYLKVRNLISEFFEKIRYSTINNVNLSDPCYVDIYKNIDAFKNIDKFKNALGSNRVRRNIPVVSYVGMDCQEPESEFDGITNPWVDMSIYYDPDYIPEDEDSDDDDDEEEKYVKNKINKFKPTNANLRSEYVKKLRSYTSKL